jgi:hypothetical protein
MTENSIAAAIAKFRSLISDQNNRSTLFNLPKDSTRTLFVDADAKKVREALASGGEFEVGRGILAPANDDVSQFELIASLDDQIILEHGLSSLYCALGFVEWADSAEAKSRTAPLVLVPVKAERNAAGTYMVRQAGKPMLNEPLLHRLGLQKSSIPSEDPLSYKPKKSHRRVKAFSTHAAVGLFSTVRTMLAERLDAAFAGPFSSHPLVSNLLQPSRMKEDANAELELSSGSITTHLPCDTHQYRALALAASGRNIVVHGPPGTGKTQTITNIIAHFAEAGKRVLLLSEAAQALVPITERLGSRISRSDTLDLSVDDSTTLRGNHGRMADLRDELNAIPEQRRPIITIATAVSYLTAIPPHWSFDIVIVDEASKMRMSYALPAIAAASQAIIVGDHQQCGPSAIIQFAQDGSMTLDGDMSILDAARAARLEAVHLARHYRSKHPSLIDFSNERFYMRRLIAAPSLHPRGEYGLILNEVRGAFEAGVNLAETDALTRRVVHQLASDETSTIAVIAATYQQCVVIAKTIRAADPVGYKRISVMHASACQGVEYDIVYLSLTHGPDSRGFQRRNFGILSDIDGHKVLNVCLTRARKRTEVFSSVDVTSLNPDARTPIGALAYFLTSHRGYQEVESTGSAPTPLSRVLRLHGFGLRDHEHNVLVTVDDTNLAAIQITGRENSLDEKSERAQLENSGWKVTSIPAEILDKERFELDPAVANMIKDLDSFKGPGIL